MKLFLQKTTNNTVAATTDESADPQESYYTPMQSALTSTALSEKETFASPKISNKQQTPCPKYTLEDKSNLVSLYYSPHYCSYFTSAVVIAFSLTELS